MKVELVDVPGLREPIPKTVFVGHADKSVDELLALTRAAQRVPKASVQEVILRELSSGDKSRQQLDDAGLRELGVKPNTVYKSGLEPLSKNGEIQAFKDGLNGGWYWRVTKMDTRPTEEPHEAETPVHRGYPSSVVKPKTDDFRASSIFEDGYPCASPESPLDEGRGAATLAEADHAETPDNEPLTVRDLIVLDGDATA